MNNNGNRPVRASNCSVSIWVWQLLPEMSRRLSPLTSKIIPHLSPPRPDPTASFLNTRWGSQWFLMQISQRMSTFNHIYLLENTSSASLVPLPANPAFLLFTVMSWTVTENQTHPCCSSSVCFSGNCCRILLFFYSCASKNTLPSFVRFNLQSDAYSRVGNGIDYHN